MMYMRSLSLRILAKRQAGLLIEGDGQPEATDGTLSWQAIIPARGEWTVSVEAVPVFEIGTG